MSKENIIRRTVTLVKDSSSDMGDHSEQGGEGEELTLADSREASAIVLLGEPGMGKTTEFEEEVKDTDGIFITARNFKTLGAENYQGEPLFIDGLDEARADGSGVVAPFDEIRRELKNMGKPFFRISCREADWLQTDKAALEKVSSNGKVTVLRLDPLTDDDIEKFLGQQDRLLISPHEFMEKARMHGVDGLMRNPRLLKNLIKATGENWPRSKAEVMKGAVNQMAQEHNEEHASIGATASEPLSERVQAAGFLCSLMLLADNPTFSMIEGVRKNDSPSLSSLIYDNHDALQEVVGSNLFKPEEGEVTYIHRSIAEYLCATYLNKCLNNDGGPSLRRILALLTGEDGVPVSPLRGVFAWLVALSSSQHRKKLIQDPLGVVLYGDVSQFTSGEVQVLLEHLKSRFAESVKDFIDMRGMESAFAGLCAPNATEHLLAVLRSSDRSKPHQMLAFCVLEAMRYGDGIENIEQLLDIFMDKDGDWNQLVRTSALKSLMDKREPEQLLEMLDDIKMDKVNDNQDDLAGLLLDKLYPDMIPPQDIFNYLHSLKMPDLIGPVPYISFWSWKLAQKTGNESASLLLDKLVTLVKRKTDLLDEYQSTHIFQMLAKLIAKALEFHGDSIDVPRLVSWLSIGFQPLKVPQTLWGRWRCRTDTKMVL